ncbi:MAG: MFS transporter [Candidatus Thorarchaeota archaeon]|jgi:DHA3 family macrolide efflux protein-like MFS transporter
MNIEDDSEHVIEEPTESMRPFFIMWSGQAVSLFGSRLVRFAVVWWVTLLTESATVLAIASIMALLPQVLLGPFAGSMVDRWNRRKVMIGADTIIAMTTAILALLFILNIVEIWHIYALMFIGSAAGAFHWPAMQASTTLMVPQEHLIRIGGMNQSLSGIAGILAPPLGALLFFLLPMQSILAIDIITAFVAILALGSIHIPQPELTESLEERSVLGDIRDGIRFIVGWRGLFLIVIMSMFINLLLVPAFSLVPILNIRHFSGDAGTLAILQMANAIGLVSGGVLLGVWGGFKRRIVTGGVGLVMAAIGTTLIGIAPSDAFLFAAGMMFLVGIMLTMSNGAAFAVLQAVVPPDIQGRVFSVIISVGSAMTPLGLAIAGPLADMYGEQTWFLIAGILMLMLTLVTFTRPDVTAIEEKAPGEEESDNQTEPEAGEPLSELE